MKRFPQLLAFALGGGLAIGFLQSLSACSESGVGLTTPIGTFASLDAASLKQIDRFYGELDVRAAHAGDSNQRDQFRDVFRHVRANYVYQVNDTVLVDAAIKGMEGVEGDAGKPEPGVLVEAALHAMLASLDPHSQYLNPEELQERRVFASGKFGGLGIQITLDADSGAVKVISPIEDTPADRAGIAANDLITHIDGEAIKGKTLAEAVKIMRGNPGTDIRLTIKRQGRDDFDVTLTRDIIKVRSVRWTLENDIAYIRINSFTEQTEPGLKRAFYDITHKIESSSAKPGFAGLKGMVLDLRNNPGGLLDQAIGVSDAFLSKGEIVSVRPRDAQRGRVHEARAGDPAEAIALVVLINEGSASASEIVAGALKDNGRAVIMGRRSFGKGSVQTIQPMPIEGALQLTTALYYVPSGYTIQALGVTPDIALTLPPAPDPSAAAGEDGNAPAADSAAGQDDTAPAVSPPPREADLPGAIQAERPPATRAGVSLARDSCPAAGADSTDRELGCALAYLRAATPAAFFAAIAPRPVM